MGVRTLGPGLVLVVLCIGAPSLAQEMTGAASSPPGELAEDEEIAGPIQQLLIGEQLLPMSARDLQLSAASLWLMTPEEHSSAHGFGVDYGVARRLQVGLAAQLALTVPQTGETETSLGNLDLNLVHTLSLSGRDGLAVSTGATATLPTGAGDDAAAGGSLVLAMYKTLGSLHANWSVRGGLLAPVSSARVAPELSHEQDGVDPFVQSVLSLALPLGAVAPFGEVGVGQADTHSIRLAVGAEMPVGETLDLVFGGVAQVEHDTAWGGGMGLTWAQSLAGE